MSNQEADDDSSMDGNVKKSLSNITEDNKERNVDNKETSLQKRLQNDNSVSATASTKTDIRENLVNICYLKNWTMYKQYREDL